MIIAVLGASGRLGRRLVSKALQAGHRVVAFVRYPIFLRLSHAALTIIRGDAKDEAALERALKDVQVVMTVLGPDAGISPDSTSKAASAVVSAMKRVGVKRLVWQTGSGVPYMGETLFGSRKAMQRALGLLGPTAMERVDEALRIIMESDLDTTVVRFNRIELVPFPGWLHIPWMSRPKTLSADDAAGIMLAQLTEAPAGDLAGRN